MEKEKSTQDTHSTDTIVPENSHLDDGEPAVVKDVVDILVSEATPEQVREKAVRSLQELQPRLLDITNELLHHGGGRLTRQVRMLCTDVWPALYNVLTCQADNPLEIWKLPKDAAIALLPEDESPGREIRVFYERVQGYYLRGPSVEGALGVIEHGVRFLQAAKYWYETTLTDRGHADDA